MNDVDTSNLTIASGATAALAGLSMVVSGYQGHYRFTLVFAVIAAVAAIEFLYWADVGGGRDR